ncbi:hypothetical protein DSM25559_1988 [Agrobacterium rosae]|uniref:HEAT repeat domain-containing protein n=2 Tax=Agrobacterium rosae TaxID=1972867 RepID=A0A1R3TKN2_9HYPH|nr:hypothetical protein DSM25559_1988 [Agrobacterium rosae]
MLANLSVLLVRRFDPLEYFRNVRFEQDFMAAAVAGLTQKNFMKRTQGLVALSVASDKASRDFLITEILRRAEMSASSGERGVYHSALYGEVDRSNDIIFKAVLDSANVEFIGNLASLLRKTPLPPEVRQKFEEILISSDADDVRIKIAQALGPDSGSFDGVFNLVLTKLISASSDDERMRWATELGKFPGRDDVVIDALATALALTSDPLKSGAIGRALAEVGENGVLRLAKIVDVEVADEKQKSMAIIMSAIGSDGAVPIDKVDFVIRTALKARLKSDDPLLRSSVYALLFKYGKASIGPIKQVLQKANEETRTDLQEILDRFGNQ